MPRSAYVIMANSGSVDQYSDKVSLFEVVETYTVTRRESRTGNSNTTFPSKSHRIIAVWLREESDGPNDLFEGQVACIAPDTTELSVGNWADFSFTQPYYRWNIELTIPGFTQLGTHFIEARIRPVGGQEWIRRQLFPFLVQDKEQPIIEINAEELAPTSVRGSAESENIYNHKDIESLACSIFHGAHNLEQRNDFRALIRKSINLVDSELCDAATHRGYPDALDHENERVKELLVLIAHKYDKLALPQERLEKSEES
jgi:hypothetical protein